MSYKEKNLNKLKEFSKSYEGIREILNLKPYEKISILMNKDYFKSLPVEYYDLNIIYVLTKYENEYSIEWLERDGNLAGVTYTFDEVKENFECGAWIWLQ